jgi:hypothetical protein
MYTQPVKAVSCAKYLTVPALLDETANQIMNYLFCFLIISIYSNILTISYVNL